MAWEKGCGLSHINNKYLSSLIVRHCRHTSFDCTSLYCAPQILCFFTSQRFVETLCQANLSVPFFPTAFAHFVSLCPILVILIPFQTSSSLLYVLWWSMISDLWCYYCNWGHYEPCPCKRVNLIHKYMCSDCSIDWLFPQASLCHYLSHTSLCVCVCVCVCVCLSLSLGLSIPWDTSVLKLSQLMIL